MNVLQRNNVQIKGQGKRPLLFIPGFGCDHNMWRYIHPAFEADYKIILMDHVGTGDSDINAFSPIKYSHLQGYADDLIEVCQELDLKDAIVIGQSVAAMISGLAYIKAPHHFAAIIMVGPSPRYINDGDYHGGFDEEDLEEMMESLESNYLGWSSATAPAVIGHPDKPALGEELTNGFCHMDPNVAKVFARATFYSDNRSDLAKIDLPVLVMQMQEDILAPEVVGRYVHAHLPNSTLAMLEATGHIPNLSAPEETIAVIKSYLKTIL